MSVNYLLNSTAYKFRYCGQLDFSDVLSATISHLICVDFTSANQ
jgi:hypothetical protein